MYISFFSNLILPNKLTSFTLVYIYIYMMTIFHWLYRWNHVYIKSSTLPIHIISLPCIITILMSWWCVPVKPTVCSDHCIWLFKDLLSVWHSICMTVSRVYNTHMYRLVLLVLYWYAYVLIVWHSMSAWISLFFF